MPQNLRSVFFKESKNFKEPVWVMAVVEMSHIDANWDALRANAVEVIGKWLS